MHKEVLERLVTVQVDLPKAKFGNSHLLSYTKIQQFAEGD